VTPGGAFDVNVWTFNPLDDTTGFDFGLSGTAGFSLIGREAGWPFNDYLLTTPSLTGDHGSVLQDVTTAQGPGLYLLERLRLGAPAAPGDYILMPTDNPGIGIVGAPPDFREWGFSRTEGLSVHVDLPPEKPAVTIPEPVAWIVLLAGFFVGLIVWGRQFREK
jgi:hypothetical protein